MQLTPQTNRPASRPPACRMLPRASVQVRKLEFIMAEAKEKGHDCVITIGGIQSNHARATVSWRPLCMPLRLCLFFWAGDTLLSASVPPRCCQQVYRLCPNLNHVCPDAGGCGSLPRAGVPPHPAQQPPPGRVW